MIKNEDDMKTGIELIGEERERQRDKLWGDAHDDAHEPGVLAQAGACYILLGKTQMEKSQVDLDDPPEGWPFEDEWWKPSKNPVRNMQKGAAMVAAEIDREQRSITD